MGFLARLKALFKPEVADLTAQENAAVSARDEKFSSEYLPSFWEDDYCQVEILPAENEAFIRSQCEEINSHATKHFDGFGFTGVMVRSRSTVPTITKGYSADALRTVLISRGLQEAAKISFDGREVLDCKTGNTKAFGGQNLDLYFDTIDGAIKNIWLTIRFSKQDSSMAAAVLHEIGESFDMVLADWNIAALIDLRDKQQIADYFNEFQVAR